MKYLKIKNDGEIDIRLICLMGASTKTDDPKKIGQFGTGLKYAISYFLRNEIKFSLFVGKEKINFSIQEESISGKDFKEIYCNGKSMNITTQYGYQWEAWEAIREIWCNATDEDNGFRKVIDDRSKLMGEQGKTIFYIEVTPKIEEVINKWEEYFLNDNPIYEDKEIAIYLNTGKHLKLYKNKVLIQNSEYYSSLFTYDLKSANLNELRQYQGYLSSDIGKALLGSSKEVVSLLLEAIRDKSKTDMYEVKMDWSYLTYSTAKVREIFAGWLFLHPLSAQTKSTKGVIVNESLFNLLRKIGLPTERIKKSSGGCYGGGGFGYIDNNEVSYKEVLNPDLQKRIEVIAVKYGSGMKYTIAIPKTDDFEVLVNKSQVIFNSSLENLSDTDLEATVLIGIFHSQEYNIYKGFKRLIKFVMGNRNFRKILFGRNINDKVKPTYQPPLIGVEKEDTEIELPF
jgi:hypothetical protein